LQNLGVNFLTEPAEATQIVSDVKSFLLTQGGRYSDWYIGITKNLGGRLFGDHRVGLNDNSWIACLAVDSEHAREAERQLLTLGCDGGPGGGSDESCGVYAYQKQRHTHP
jgi:hypothetical protein